MKRIFFGTILLGFGACGCRGTDLVDLIGVDSGADAAPRDGAINDGATDSSRTNDGGSDGAPITDGGNDVGLADSSDAQIDANQFPDSSAADTFVEAAPRVFECVDFGSATSFTAACQATTVSCVNAASSNAAANTCLNMDSNRNACVSCLNDSLTVCVVNGIPSAPRRTAASCALACANLDLETQGCGSDQTCVADVIDSCLVETNTLPADFDVVITCLQSDNAQCIVAD